MNFARGGGGDHMTLLRCYSDWSDNSEFSSQWCFENYVQVKTMGKARDIRDQLERLCERVEVDSTVSNPAEQDSILKSITSGFFYNTAKLGKSGEYQTVKQKRTVYIHPSTRSTGLGHLFWARFYHQIVLEAGCADPTRLVV